MNKKYKDNKTRKAMTLIEVIIVMGIMVLLSGAVYSIFRSVGKSFSHAQNKLDILQATRIIMTGIRNDIRNAQDKIKQYDGYINIPISPSKISGYYYDKENRRLYRYTKDITEPDPDVSEMRPFLFNDGQILDFTSILSFENDQSFVESQLALNARVWAKISMKILYSEKFDKLTEEEKAKIIANPDDDPRVKTFFMFITPRKLNWTLQGTQ